MSMTLVLHPHLHHVSRSLLMGSIFLKGIFLEKENFVYPKDLLECFLGFKVRKVSGGLILSYMIDDSFVWRLCGFIVWRCMTSAYLRVYSMHKYFRSRVKYVVCQCLIL